MRRFLLLSVPFCIILFGVALNNILYAKTKKKLLFIVDRKHQYFFEVLNKVLIQIPFDYHVLYFNDTYIEDFSKFDYEIIVFVLTKTTNTKTIENDIFELQNDFRVAQNFLSHITYSILKLDENVDEEFILQLNSFLIKNQARNVTQESSLLCDNYDNTYKNLKSILLQLKNKSCKSNCGCKDKETTNGSTSQIVDLEDLAPALESTSKENEMINPSLRSNLTKQGYKLVETHSAVKVCRWTKAMLRGRGGCYKHTFYGIDSHRCMEATPSLACANKCVFCWRHHSNPVGTSWKWKMDPPEIIAQKMIEEHIKAVKPLKGIPGVTTDKFNESLKIRHCALSLVGEPIMYPRINDLIKLLHKESISTFLVTNAQFPDAIRDLIPITQLYVSIDAATKQSLKEIDRPLFPDFWERFLNSLECLKHKKQRTVYRLTLVKGWNMEDVNNYGELIKIGEPDFIEIKGVTYSGYTNDHELSMKNVPYYEEVLEFGELLVKSLTEHELCVEHQHSNSILISHKKYKINGEWHTWINYEKFQELFEIWLQNPDEEINSLDYCEKTPWWGLVSSKEQGFDPNEQRIKRKAKLIS